MEHKTIAVCCSLVIGFFSLGVIYFTTANFDNAPTGERTASFLSMLFQRNKKEETKRFIARIEAFDDAVHPYREILANNRYDELLSYIASQCPKDTPLLGTQRYEELRLAARKSDKVMEQSLGVRILLSAEKFEKISAQRYKWSDLSKEEYCIQKYAHVAYQKRLSEVHMDLALRTGILRNQQQVSATEVTHQKKTILTFIENRDKEAMEHIAPVYEHGSAEEEETLSLYDKENPLRELSNEERQLADLFIAIAKAKIFKNLALLQNLTLLSVDDRVRIIANIDLIIPESCYNRDAHYAFLERGVSHEAHERYYEYDAQKRTMSYDISLQHTFPRNTDSNVRVYKNMELLGNNMIYKDGKIIKFTGLSFSLPICGNYRNLIEFSEMLEYTILHELGHYYMHRNDPHPEEFTSLCRDESNSRTCDIDAFVTEYAATSAVEDYADTFAHIVYEKLYGYLPLGLVSEEKRNYFLHHRGMFAE